MTTTYIKEELERNFKKSFSGKRKKEILFELEMFISECEIKTTQEYVDHLQEAKEKISLKDAPILACGMLPDIDYLITSDKEFFGIEIDKVKILSSGDARYILL